MTVEHLPNRRVCDPRLASDQARTPASALSRITDPFLAGRVEQTWRTMRTTRPIDRPRQRMSLLYRSDTISMPPPMSCCRRDAQQSRGLPERHPTLNRLAQCQTPSWSELRSTVDLHPGPPRVVSLRRPTAWDEARMPPQPFTTCVGTSADMSSCLSSGRGWSRRWWPAWWGVWLLGRGAGLGVGVASLMMRGLGTPGPGFVLPACAV
jgi:hypothetical protein